MPKKIKIIGFFTGLVILLSVKNSVLVQAAVGFPEIMAGNTMVTINGQTVYGGLGGNYAILNSDTSASYGFKKAVLDNSCLSDAAGPVCFFLGTGVGGSSLFGTSGGRLMTAKTTIDGDVVYEIPALLFSGLNINGDVSGDNLGYLKFWSSANLLRGNGTTGDGVGWNLGNYVFNPAAQVKLGSEQYIQYSAKLATLAGSGSNLPSNIGIFATGVGEQIYLQSSNITDGSAVNSEVGKYPDGKVWSVNGGLVNGDLTIAANSKITFSGVGTIIVKGNLNVGSGASFVPADANSRLGIIVLHNTAGAKGNCTFGGNNKVQAMVFCTEKFAAVSNGEFTGSFVASDFAISANSSVIFTYDPAFDNSQPPGFRSLLMPGTKEVGNQ